MGRTVNSSECDGMNKMDANRAKAFLARRTFGLLIDGEVCAARSGETMPTFDPSTGEVLGWIAGGGAADVDRAVAAARAAFEGEWSGWTPYRRQEFLFRARDLFDRNYEELAQIEATDMGAPISRVRGSKAGTMRMIQFFATMALSIRGETLPNGLPGDVTTMTIKAPAGVIGGIIPWNGSIVSMWWIIGATLATGCTAVIKPAEDASLTVLRAVEMLYELGLPRGVINVVTGLGVEAGDALARHPGVDRLAFTGSTATGQKIIEASTVNIKRLQLELGGKSPDIVFADADLDRAVPGAAMGCLANTGQICFAGTRILVERRIAETFTARMRDYVETLRVGRSLDPDVDLGPVISRKQLERVQSFVDLGVKEGARLVCGGEPAGGALDAGYFMQPTVFADVDMAMTIAREEIFGPVVSIIPFDTVDEAVRIGNQTVYGLAGAVWSRDIATALNVVKRIHAGVMWVNAYGLIDPLVGFGGTKMSGYGAKGGLAHLDTYLYTKCVYIQS